MDTKFSTCLFEQFLAFLAALYALRRRFSILSDGLLDSPTVQHLAGPDEMLAAMGFHGNCNLSVSNFEHGCGQAESAKDKDARKPDNTGL